MSDILDLDGKVTLITGAGQGVGRQIALHFAAHNAAGIVVNDYFLERAEQVAREINAAGGKAIALQADVTDLASVRAMIGKAEQAFGPIDVLVNNAGNAGATPDPDARKPFWETGPEVWNSFIGVNLYGVINCASACIPQMIERKGGRIVTIISDAGRAGEAGLEVYSGAKAGAAGFTRAVARSLGRHNITANCVAIAATLTPAIEARLKANPEMQKKMMEKYVIRRPGLPSDVANMVLFLASEASAWITGQTYPVNGGFTFAL
ncbi:SDR family oxidoreductase [Bradyrhizobium viridifuturi]|jgi:2-hydroxycyclohexanecarboxyl-CoA dehydrogenase|nr:MULTISPECIES: SDR family oxidoreductase [Bradyrhizobium]ERF86481.1 MAG: 3-oxoacyl-[acyl-carrier protein] reductase [Bradyrhizobium sp. DFCI-1]OYU61211.1 MAG: oxidoreductase [Bradyrhizobium sp. PARBB1]PSO29458.1 KR domain-containing protein [Bradyrhizobium sp. MOS004]QRI71230.1 SDR family oxidoreductase [Bradyrhizobium sp. PSBB068]MBR1020185.1 SDR family oxidoreductase [Bradyrhizobium viridifuturi]